MSANKKTTNKTAHVLNLITAGRESNSTPGHVQPSADGFSSSAAPAAPLTPPVMPMAAPTLVEVEPDPEDLSAQVLEALSKEYAQEALDQPPPAASTPSVPPPQPPAPPVAEASLPSAGSPSLDHPTAPEKEDSPNPAGLAAPWLSGGMSSPPLTPPSPDRLSFGTQADPVSGRGVSGSPQPVCTPAESGEGSVPQITADAGGYVNVMQALVEEKAPQFMELMGVCSCGRCLADVKALTLSHLAPKYVVVPEGQEFPYSLYENRYHAAVTSQLITACRTVMEHPRH